MAYEEVSLRDMKWMDDIEAFTYQCPCGDLFQITLEEMESGEDIGQCPSCSLYIVVEYGPADLVWAREVVKEANAKNAGLSRGGVDAVPETVEAR